MERPQTGGFFSALSTLLSPFIRLLDRPALPQYEGTLTLPSLHQSVTIQWQSHGIPNVSAANQRDLFFAQGYLHAQERLWQMDMNRRFLTGRMAEVFGNFPLPWRELTSQFRGRDSGDFDYFMRLIGIRQAALDSLELLSEDERGCLDAYSEGVNSYIERCGKKPPWEFRLLRYDAEPWRPQDSLTISKGFSLLVSPALFTRLNILALAARLDGQTEKLRSLLPAYPAGEPTTTRALWDWTEGLWRFFNGAFAAADRLGAGQGSNSWVVAPHRSASGNSLLCNDPHLRLTLPAVWYSMHLRSEPEAAQPDGYEAWGASIPGVPGIQVGHNRWLAWGVTASLCDDVEIYREKIHRLEPDCYLAGHQWRSMVRRDETIRMRGGAAVDRGVRLTRHGPVISDFNAGSRPAETLAFRWTAHDPSNELRCLLGINRARNWAEFLAALSHQGAPALNYLYADRQGNIGYSLAGKIPIRPRPPTLLPQPGWSEQEDWRGYIPFDDLPRIYNPPDGVIANANNRITDSAYPYYLSRFFEPPYRLRRIEELLTAKQTFSLRDMEEMQSDCVSLHGRALIESLRADLTMPDDGSRLKAVADRLLGWSGECGERSVAATIFHVFHQRLLANLLLPDLGETLFKAYLEILNQCLAPTDAILKDPASPWFAERPRSDLVAQSLREACDELGQKLGEDIESWHWGRLHSLTLNHFLGRLKILRPLLSAGPFFSSGDGTTINLGHYRHSDPYQHGVGASLRFIIDLGPRQRAGFVLSSGQSGHPFSRHYADQIALWRRHEYLQLDGTEEEMRQWPLLTLTPPT